MPEKPKIAMYWACSCGGCEISLTNINEKLINLSENFDLVFCPCLLDTKYEDVKKYSDNELLISFINGGIRNEENVEIIKLLRKKSQLLIAFGSCSMEGCIPALANLSTKKQLLEEIFLKSLTVDNPEKIIPSASSIVPEGTIEIPFLLEKVQPVSSVVLVDYSIPGCPPESHQVWNILEHVIQNKPLPEKGSILGAGNQTVCEECKKIKEEKRVAKFYRTYEIIPDATKCLLEQGLLCMGIATRNGCGALCPEVNMPCTGCYGAVEAQDQGARMISALGSIIDFGNFKDYSDSSFKERALDKIKNIPDPAGVFYRYSMAGSLPDKITDL